MGTPRLVKWKKIMTHQSLTLATKVLTTKIISFKLVTNISYQSFDYQNNWFLIKKLVSNIFFY